MKNVTIGIPAFNEEANIAHVVQAMLNQNEDGFVIDKIIVASDGSSDATAAIVRSIKDERLVLIDDPIRRGKNFRQNQLFSKASGDIVVLVDADIRFDDPKTIAKITAPIRSGNAELTGYWAIPDAPRTFLEKVLIAGHNFKQLVYRSFRNGNNIYTCVGHMRAFSKPLYQKLKFDEFDSNGEDQFSYLQSISLGFRYMYPETIIAYFKLPSNLGDYLRYAKRIFATQKKFADEFGIDFVNSERKIPSTLILKSITLSLFKYPIILPVYIFLHGYVSVLGLFVGQEKNAFYDISRSTK